jgi:hypothetical protein
MLDFTATLGPEMVRAVAIERELEIKKNRWQRRLRELDGSGREPRNLRRTGRFGKSARRRALFVEGLDAAQREGITVDAWFGFRFADPELSARAEWTGLVEDAVRTKKDAWAA